MNIFLWNLFIIGGFLAGGIMFSKAIPKRLCHKDVSKLSDDGNPGAFNAFAHCGKRVGMLCLVLDVLKGFIPVFLASLFLNTENLLFSLVIAAPVLGHAAGVFNGFHGGKCIAVSFGVMLGLIPVIWYGIVALAAFYIFFSTAVKINPNSRRSIVVYTLFGAVTCAASAATGQPAACIGCAAVALTAVVKHVKALPLEKKICE